MDAYFRERDEPETDLIVALRDSVQNYARGRASRAGVQRGSSLEWDWQDLADLGWLGLLASEDRGGAALSPSVLVALYEELGRGGAVENYAAIGVLTLVALECCEAGPARNLLIEGLIGGSMRPVLCWQDTEGRDECDIIFAHPQKRGGDLMMSDTRKYVDFIDSATHFCLPVDADGCRGLLLVTHGMPGLALETAPALAGGRIGAVKVNGAFPASSFLPLSKQASLEPAFVLARMAAAAQLAGLAGRMLDLTVEYLKQRVQFGKPIAANQVVQHRLVDMWGQIELSRAAVAHAATSCAAGMSQAEIASLAAKAQAGAAVEYAAKWAFQLHGAIGYTGEYELGGLARGALSLNLWLGAVTKMRRRLVELERKSLGKSENG